MHPVAAARMISVSADSIEKSLASLCEQLGLEMPANPFQKDAYDRQAKGLQRLAGITERVDAAVKSKIEQYENELAGARAPAPLPSQRPKGR